MSDVGTVTPHAVVGYCILWWLTSTQDVLTELLEGFFVVKWIDCFRALCVCVCERVSIYAVNKICLCPQTMADRALLCVRLQVRDGYTQVFFFFHGLLGFVGCHGNC